jgi:Na+(H+)/acetate symporter ActP
MDVNRRDREFSTFIIVLFYIETEIIIAGIEREISTQLQQEEVTETQHIPWVRSNSDTAHTLDRK